MSFIVVNEVIPFKTVYMLKIQMQPGDAKR